MDSPRVVKLGPDRGGHDCCSGRDKERRAFLPAFTVPLTCPGCDAALSLIVDPTDPPEHGVLVCEHGHIYDVDDPDDNRELQAKLGPAYRNKLHT